MNEDLYSEEFRNFKYLSSSPETVRYYKAVAQQINSIQAWGQTNDPTFVWPCRLEFVDQLLDLRDRSVFIVAPGNLYGVDASMKYYDYEESKCVEFVKPIVYRGRLLVPELGKIATAEDIPNIEKNIDDYCLCSSSYFYKIPTGPHLMCLIASTPLNTDIDMVNYKAMFYDGDTAKAYAKALTDCLRKNQATISAIGKMF